MNASAERACQLASDFKDRMPKDPKQQSKFFSTITQQRRDRSDLSRKALSKANYVNNSCVCLSVSVSVCLCLLIR